MVLLALILIVLGWYDTRFFLEQPARARIREAEARAAGIAAQHYDKYCVDYFAASADVSEPHARSVLSSSKFVMKRIVMIT